MKRKEFFQVAFVNRKGQWTMDGRKFTTRKGANRWAGVISKKAMNGRVSVRIMCGVNSLT